jgi:hypothetical protein
VQRVQVLPSPAETQASRHEREAARRRFVWGMVVVVAVSAFAGYRLFKSAEVATPEPPAGAGGILVLTSARHMAIRATYRLGSHDEYSAHGPSFTLSIRFIPTRPRPIVGRASLEQLKAGGSFRLEDLPHPKPFRIAVVFSGDSLPVTGVAAASTGQDYPDVSCRLCLGASGDVSWLTGPVNVRVSDPGVPTYTLGEADGYTAAAPRAVASQLMTPGLLRIRGSLRRPASRQAGGRTQGAITLVPARFPANAESAADIASGGARITDIRIPGRAEPKMKQVGVRISRVPTTLYPPTVRLSSLTLDKGLFDRLDYSFPEAELVGTRMSWQGQPRNSPFTWQLTNDRAVDGAAARGSRYALLAGLALGLAASAILSLLERLFDHWDVRAALRRRRRLLSGIAAFLCTMVFLLVGFANNVTTISSGNEQLLRFDCPAPLEKARARSAAAKPMEDALEAELQADCEASRRKGRGIAIVAGCLAILFWLPVLRGLRARMKVWRDGRPRRNGPRLRDRRWRRRSKFRRR